MQIYFAGGENPTQLRRLLEHDVDRICVSYYGWQSAHATDNLSVIPEHVRLIVHAGVSRQKNLDWSEFALNYLEFVERNHDRVEFVYELDSAHCPTEIRQSLRHALEPIPGVVMVPHRSEAPQLALTAAKYERVLVNATLSKRLEQRDLRRTQATLFGSNILSTQKLAAGRFAATTTMAWLSPRRYGELLIYTRTGKVMHYEATERKRAVELHRTEINAYGLDHEACAQGDLPTLTTLAIRSIQQMADQMVERPRDRKTSALRLDHHDPIEEQAVTVSPAPLAYKKLVEQLRVPLPSLEPPRQPGRSFSATKRSLRQCDTCSLAEVCPKHEPHAECSFDIPVEIATREDWISACQVILDFQFQRVTFGHFSEQLDGGAITDKVGREMDRFMRLLQQVQTIQHTQDQAEGGSFTQHLKAITGQLEERMSNDQDLSASEGGQEDDVERVREEIQERIHGSRTGTPEEDTGQEEDTPADNVPDLPPDDEPSEEGDDLPEE